MSQPLSGCGILGARVAGGTKGSTLCHVMATSTTVGQPSRCLKPSGWHSWHYTSSALWSDDERQYHVDTCWYMLHSRALHCAPEHSPEHFDSEHIWHVWSKHRLSDEAFTPVNRPQSQDFRSMGFGIWTRRCLALVSPPMVAGSPGSAGFKAKDCKNCGCQWSQFTSCTAALITKAGLSQLSSPFFDK